MQDNINVSLAIEKGIIINDDFTNYERLAEKYKLLFTKYLESKIDFKKYDDKLFNSDLDFGVMPKEYQNEYQKESYLNLKYIYIRNNFYIEKLNVDDIKYLYNINIDINFNQDITDFIERTYRDVINDNYKHGKYVEKTTTCYGAFIPDNIVNSNALAICIQYGKNNKKYSDKEYLDNLKLKRFFLDNLSIEMKIDIMQSLKVETVILIRNFVGEN